MSLSATAELVGGRLRGGDATFRGVSIDTRTLNADELFVALAGRHHDAHTFLSAAAERGAAGALVSRAVADLPCVEVPDTLKAMGRLAAGWRRRMELTAIGVTGSNGKTTVKEMIAAILSRSGPTFATPGNYNNHIGVPLTLFRLGPEHRYAIIEMGANHPGEIASLSRLARPDIGVVTNAAAAHLEGFGDLEGVARGKGELFAALGDDGVAVVNVDDPYADLWRGLAGHRRTLGFGLGAGAEVTAEALTGAGFTLVIGDERLPVTLNLPGRHNVLNALAAAACAHAAGAPVADIAADLARVRPVAGRLEWKPTRSGARLLDDTYNANPASLQVALDVLAGEPGEHWLVLGDMGELGADSRALHRRAADLAASAGITRLYTLGPRAALAAQRFAGHAQAFDDLQPLTDALDRDLHDGVACLVKGSRAMGMEHVVAVLTGNDGAR